MQHADVLARRRPRLFLYTYALFMISPEAAAAGDDVLPVVEPALLVPELARLGAEHLRRRQAAVEPQRVDRHVRVIGRDPPQVLRA